MRGLRYVGPIFDFSGYGEASRNYVLSLHKKGIPITVHPRCFDVNPPKIANDEEREVIESLVDKVIEYDINIIHLTPDLYPLYAQVGKYNIGFVAWETSLLHPKWSESMQVVNEMFVPCRWNEEALIKSGVKKPITIIPHGIDTDLFDNVSDKFNIGGIDENTFKFYSIFQWSNRKNPDNLLRAYFNAFGPDDDVVLILKTYVGSNVGQGKKFLKEYIRKIKRDMGFLYYPKVLLIGDLLSSGQMLALHKSSDCYVSMHRGEGWGIPMFRAGLAGKPVIATNGGGNLEFMGKDNSYLINAQETFVSGMSNFNAWYLSNQTWFDPSPLHAVDLMREVYFNQQDAKQRGLLLKENIKDNFSWDKVSEVLVGRLNEI